MKNYTVRFEIPSYLGEGSGEVEMLAPSYTATILRLQEICPKLMVNRQMVSQEDALAAGYQPGPCTVTQ